MDKREFQTALKLRGNYHYLIDGALGAMSKAAFDQAVTEGVDRKLTDDVIKWVAKSLNVPPSRIYAVKAVEAGVSGFGTTGKALVLPEPHRFSKLTGGKYDKVNPLVSYPVWDPKKYPAGQDVRWDRIFQMIQLDVDAGLMAASHGMFQILGENYAACGFSSPFDFVMAMSLSEDAQLEAFVQFVSNKRIRGKSLVDWLREGRFDYFAEGYNGTGYRQNSYDTKLASADKNAQRYNV